MRCVAGGSGDDHLGALRCHAPNLGGSGFGIGCGITPDDLEAFRLACLGDAESELDAILHRLTVARRRAGLREQDTDHRAAAASAEGRNRDQYRQCSGQDCQGSHINLPIAVATAGGHHTEFSAKLQEKMSLRPMATAAATKTTLIARSPLVTANRVATTAPVAFPAANTRPPSHHTLPVRAKTTRAGIE